MGIAIALILIVIGSLVFHFYSPWVATPLASNWGAIDDTITLTFVITGLVFIIINLFIALAVYRYAYHPQRKAKYEPENTKLEIGLILLTSIGIVAMLAPGLMVYKQFVSVPKDALTIEVFGQQWSWSFRLPGKDKTLGLSAVQHISIDNPFGLDPLDPAAQDDVLIHNNRLLLPLNQSVKILMRSKDVLHDFYVPQFRVKMDMVPGTVSFIWLTPTLLGEFEILCAEYCGLGHFNMRGHVEVVPPSEFASWWLSKDTFAASLLDVSGETLSATAKRGQDLAQVKGCLGCHNFSNSAIGPSWLGLFGKTQILTDGRSILVDEAYLKESILVPNAKLVKGFAAIMPATSLNDLDVKALIAYIKEKGRIPLDNNKLGLKLSGQDLAISNGCTACHSDNGDEMLGPTWQGLYGSTRLLSDGQTVLADDEYLMGSILQPNANIVAGFAAVMPPPRLNQEEALAIIDFIKTL
jgi:cytochrome c oxidase subunit 2